MLWARVSGYACDLADVLAAMSGRSASQKKAGTVLLVDCGGLPLGARRCSNKWIDVREHKWNLYLPSKAVCTDTLT